MPFIVTPRQLIQRAELFHQLAQLTSAGIGIIPALGQIKRSPPARSYREPLQRLLDELARGATVAESLHRLGWLPAFDALGPIRETANPPTQQPAAAGAPPYHR